MKRGEEVVEAAEAKKAAREKAKAEKEADFESATWGQVTEKQSRDWAASR